MDENAGSINRATDLRIGDQALNNWMRQSLFVDNTPGLYPHGMASPYFFFFSTKPNYQFSYKFSFEYKWSKITNVPYVLFFRLLQIQLQIQLRLQILS